MGSLHDKKKIFYWVQSIWQTVVASVLPLFTSSTFTNSGGKVGGTLTYSSPAASAEAAELPEAYDTAFTGTLTEGQDLSITFKVRNNSSQADGAHTLKLYRTTDVNGSGETLVTTLTGGNQVGDVVTFTYTILSAVNGYFIMFEPIPKLADGTAGTGDRSKISATTVSAAASIYDYFNIGWADNTGFPADWNSNPAAVWTKRAGAFANWAKGATFPDLVDSATDYFDFIQANSDFISSVMGGVSFSAGWELWLEVQSIATSGTHPLVVWSGTGSLRSVSGNVQLRLGGTAATLFPASAINGHYLVRIQCNGGTSGNKAWIKQKGAVGYLVSSGPQYNVATDVGSTVPINNTTFYVGSSNAGATPYGTLRLSAIGMKSAAGLDADAQLIFDDF